MYKINISNIFIISKLKIKNIFKKLDPDSDI